MSSPPGEPSTDAPARKPPKFVPFALLAFGSAAVVIPFFLLRRARARATVNELAHAPPQRAVQSTLAPRATEPPARQLPSADYPPDPGALDPLYALKAFSIATGIVGASALAGVWAVRQSLGVQNMEEFADRMRMEVQTLAPVLSARIYSSPAPAHTSPHGSPTPSNTNYQQDEEDEEWTWADAARRLSHAYEEGGLSSWMEAAGHELEREARLERGRRGHHEHEDHLAETQNTK